ncbi:MAG: AsnC family transcriptional regulator [Methanomassiliicoccales archaeon]|jgi:DNA-binding Lrp family transcriptional regulator
MRDDLDQRILQTLQKNGKLTYEEVGRLLGRSPSTVRDRIEKMEADRTILGYSAIADQERLGIYSDSYLCADIDPGRMSSAVSALFSIENVSEILSVTGERRMMMRIRARSNRELVEIIDRRLKPLGFFNIKTIVVLDSLMHYPGL